MTRSSNSLLYNWPISFSNKTRYTYIIKYETWFKKKNFAYTDSNVEIQKK